MAGFIHMNHLIIVIMGFRLTGCTYYENELIKIPESDVPNPLPF
ncbi:MAG: hypothetical protein AABY93_05125 [Bacteroidota bacterium]